MGRNILFDSIKYALDEAKIAATITMLHEDFSKLGLTPKYSEGLEFFNRAGVVRLISFGSCKDSHIMIPPTTPNGDQVLTIGEYLFADDDSSLDFITAITIPSGVITVEDNAFNYLQNLSYLYIPKSVEYFGNYQFVNCRRALEQIVVEEGNPNYSGKGNCFVDLNTKTLLYGFTNSVIPADGSVTTIGYGAFSYAKFTNIVIPNTVTSIERIAFEENINLVEITIPHSVTSLDNFGIFQGCTSLNKVSYEGTMAEWQTLAKDWHSLGYGVPTKEVICSDGIFTYN